MPDLPRDMLTCVRLRGCAELEAHPDPDALSVAAYACPLGDWCRAVRRGDVEGCMLRAIGGFAGARKAAPEYRNN